MSVRNRVVELCKIGKRYGGKRRGRWALKDTDLLFCEGEVVGFIGPNGAGKTTLIKLLCGLSHATEGDISVLGEDLRKRTVTPDGIGLVLESPGFIPYLSGKKNLKLLADIRGRIGNEEIVETLRLVGLDPEDKRPTRAYSLGMRQRLGLAQALMEKPKLLILDEPTNGLDPAGIIELRNLIRTLAKDGVAVFLASHLLTEVEQVCDRVLLVKDGRVQKEIGRTDIASSTLRIGVSDKSDVERLLLWGEKSGTKIEAHPENPLSVEVLTDATTPEVVRGLVEAGVNIESVVKSRRSLEQEFMDLIGTSE